MYTGKYFRQPSVQYLVPVYDSLAPCAGNGRRKKTSPTIGRTRRTIRNVSCMFPRNSMSESLSTCARPGGSDTVYKLIFKKHLGTNLGLRPRSMPLLADDLWPISLDDICKCLQERRLYQVTVTVMQQQQRLCITPWIDSVPWIVCAGYRKH